MVVHPAPGNWTGTLVNALIGRGGELADGGGEERAGIVHRLDKETSGLIIVAKTEIAHPALGARSPRGAITRLYAAMAWGHLDADTLTVAQPIARDPRDRKRMAVVSTGRMPAPTSRASRVFECGPASRAAAFRPHASDPRAPRVGRASGAR